MSSTSLVQLVNWSISVVVKMSSMKSTSIPMHAMDKWSEPVLVKQLASMQAAFMKMLFYSCNNRWRVQIVRPHSLPQFWITLRAKTKPPRKMYSFLGCRYWPPRKWIYSWVINQTTKVIAHFFECQSKPPRWFHVFWILLQTAKVIAHFLGCYLKPPR